MIYHIARNACIRVMKEVISLRKAKIKTCVLGKSFGHQDMISLVGPVAHWQTEEDLLSTLWGATAEDTYHVHAEPTDQAGLAHFIRKSLGDKAVIVLDVHDSAWGAGQKAHPLEQLDLDAADAVIVPSTVYQNRLRGTRASIVIPSGCLVSPDDGIETGLPRLGGIVYEGGIGINDWRDYTTLFSDLSDAGVPVFCYSTSSAETVCHYHRTGVVMQFRHYRDLMVQLTRHDWALVCPPDDGNVQWDAARPNKFYESLAAGLPILTYGCKDVAEAITQSHPRVGIIFKNRAELVEWAKGRTSPNDDWRENCRQWARDNAMMSDQVPNIIKMYEIARTVKGVK